MVPPKFAPHPLAYVHLGPLLDADRYRAQYLAGKEPDETPYGFHLAAEYGYNLLFSKDAPPEMPTSLLQRGRNKALRASREWLGLDLLHAYANRNAICLADLIWTMTERDAFAIAALMCAKVVPKRPIVANVVWLLDDWASLSWDRRALFRHLAHHVAVMTVHSEKCLEVARQLFPTVRSQLVYFGVNWEIFRITPPAERRNAAHSIRIFAPGHDRTRDWEVLVDAFGNDARFELTIACRWLPDKLVASAGNLTVFESDRIADFVEEYRRADLVVVPMKENIYSGITVALEAAALGVPLLSTRTGGVPTYFDEDEVFYVPPGDPTAMRDAVLSCDVEERCRRARKAQARTLSRDYSTRGLMRQYSQLSEAFLPSCRTSNDISPQIRG